MPLETRDVESKATQWPQWVLVGRVGAGKSALFTRLIGSGSSPGLIGHTRDWVEQEISHAGGVIRLVDTAGYPNDEEPLRQAAWRQTQCVIRQADRLVLVTDARAGLLQGDEKLVQQLRRAGKPIVIAANKADSIVLRHEAVSVFSTLGIPVVPVSASQGDGIEQLFQVLASLPLCHSKRSEKGACPSDQGREGGGGNDKEKVTPREEVLPLCARQDDKEQRCRPARDDNGEGPPSPKFVVLGRPNAGKSTFLNSLLRQERYVTSSVAGTTLDAVASMWQGKEQLYHLVDTPGLRRRSRAQQPFERAGGQVVTTALRSSHVALLLIDIAQGVTLQDAKIASLVHRRRRGLVLVVSKWDQARKQGISQAAFADSLRRDLPFLSYAPLVFVSAWSRTSVMRAVRAAQNVCNAYHKRCSTSAINRCLHQAMQDHKPPRVRGRPLKMNFGWQDASAPPVFCLTCNRPAEVPDSYERYLIRRLRDAFGFVGVPITLVFRPKNP